MPSYAASEAYFNYLEGLLQERSGNMAKALEAYEKVIAQDPQALQVYRDIAELQLRMGQPDAALRAAERAKDLAPDDPASFLFLGNVRVAQGNLAKAAEAYERALELDPSNLRALENLGNYYAILDTDKALSYYERYLQINPRDPDIYFQMALVHQKKGRFAKALPLYKKSLELDPQQLASHLALADLYERERSTAAAAAQYALAAQLQPGNPLILMRLGHLYYRDQKWDEAYGAFKAVADLAPQDATTHYWLARAAEEKKRWREASNAAEKAYALSQDPQFLPLAAYYLTLDRRIEEAVRWLEKARQADPNNANVLLFLGMNYLDLDKPEKAEEALAKGVELYPKDPQMRFHLAIAEDRLGRFEEAVKQFQELLEIDPKNAPALNYLGYSWADRGVRLEEAEKLLRQAVDQDPENGAFLDSLGWVRFKRGAYGDARAFLEKAVQRSPDALIYDHLGDVYLAEQHPEPAVQAWTKTLSLDPKNAAVQKKIKQAAGQILGGSNARRYLKYLEGNLRQIQSLRSQLQVRARWSRRPIQAEGRLYFVQPDRMALDVSGTEKRAGMRVLLEGERVRLEPLAVSGVERPQQPQGLSGLAHVGLSSLSQFFAGQLTESLEASFDSRRGVQTHFSRANPSGGRDEIDVVSYDFVEGLWLPTEMRLRNATQGWDARLKFSEWIVNDPGNSQPFKKPK